MRKEVVEIISIIALVIYRALFHGLQRSADILNTLIIYLYIWNASTQRVGSRKRLHKNKQSNHDIVQHITKM